MRSGFTSVTQWTKLSNCNTQQYWGSCGILLKNQYFGTWNCVIGPTALKQLHIYIWNGLQSLMQDGNTKPLPLDFQETISCIRSFWQQKWMYVLRCHHNPCYIIRWWISDKWRDQGLDGEVSEGKESWHKCKRILIIRYGQRDTVYSWKNLCEIKSSHSNADEEVNLPCNEAMLNGK
jgi:hypothetical protein